MYLREDTEETEKIRVKLKSLSTEIGWSDGRLSYPEVKYYRTSGYSTEFHPKVNYFWSVYLPEGVEDTAENRRQFGFTLPLVTGEVDLPPIESRRQELQISE